VGGDAGALADLRTRAIGGNEKARENFPAVGKLDIEML
jgi:hypothetical protein